MNNLYKQHQHPSPSGSKKHHTYIKGASLNARNLQDDFKIVDLIINAKKFKQDFILLQESHRNGREDFKIDHHQFRRWRFLGSGFQKCRKAGVAILLSPACEVKYIDYVLEARILRVLINIRGQSVALTSAYCPDESHSDALKLIFWTALNKSISNTKAPFKPLIGGDFNATILPQSTQGLGPVHSKCCYEAANSTSFNGQQLLNTARES